MFYRGHAALALGGIGLLGHGRVRGGAFDFGNFLHLHIYSVFSPEIDLPKISTLIHPK